MKPWLAGAIFILLPLTVAACGPVWSTSNISKARDAITAMEETKALEYAPYEYYSSKLYLAKALEMQAYSQFQSSAEFGEKALKFAEEARKRALNKQQLILPEGPPPEPEVKGPAAPPGVGLPPARLKSNEEKNKSPAQPAPAPGQPGIAPVEEQVPGAAVPELGGGQRR